MSRVTERHHPGQRHRGFALLVTLLVLVLGVATFVVSALTGDPSSEVRDPERSRTLARARAAVLAYAQFGGTNNKPGALPCPDTSDPTDSGDVDQLGRAGNHCKDDEPDAVYLGRLPWRTIDLARRPFKGESDIWYAIDGHFEDHPGDPADPIILNAGTAAELEIRGADPGEPGVFRVAVLILPGDPLLNRPDRPSVDPSAYLEGENADGDTVFRDCAEVDDCNDRVIGIKADTLFREVQLRVLSGIERAVRNAHDRLGHVPWAAAFDSTGLACDAGRVRGRIPRTNGDCSGADNYIQDDDFESQDTWIIDNNWDRFIVYEVAAECAPDESNCGSGNLMVDGEGGMDVVVAGVGRAFEDQSRPGSVADYLDNEINRDTDGEYVNQPPGPGENDVFRGISVGP